MALTGLLCALVLWHIGERLHACLGSIVYISTIGEATDLSDSGVAPAGDSHMSEVPTEQIVSRVSIQLTVVNEHLSDHALCIGRKAGGFVDESQVFHVGFSTRHMPAGSGRRGGSVASCVAEKSLWANVEDMVSASLCESQRVGQFLSGLGLFAEENDGVHPGRPALVCFPGGPA